MTDEHAVPRRWRAAGTVAVLAGLAVLVAAALALVLGWI